MLAVFAMLLAPLLAVELYSMLFLPQLPMRHQPVGRLVHQ